VVLGRAVLDGVDAVDRADLAALSAVVLPMAGLLAKTLLATAVQAGRVVVPRMEAVLLTVIGVVPVAPRQMAADLVAALPTVAPAAPASADLARAVPADSVLAAPADSAEAVVRRRVKSCLPRWSTN
jgi:hypothetical protein